MIVKFPLGPKPQKVCSQGAFFGGGGYEVFFRKYLPVNMEVNNILSSYCL